MSPVQTSLANGCLVIAASLASLGLAGCANTPMAQAALAPAPLADCDSNAGYAMAGVVHASTKRDFDACRQVALRPSQVRVSQNQSRP